MHSSFEKSFDTNTDSISANLFCNPCNAFKTFPWFDCKTPNIIDDDVPANLLVDLNPGPTNEVTSSGVARTNADEIRNGR